MVYKVHVKFDSGYTDKVTISASDFDDARIKAISEIENTFFGYGLWKIEKVVDIYGNEG